MKLRRCIGRSCCFGTDNVVTDNVLPSSTFRPDREARSAERSGRGPSAPADMRMWGHLGA